MPTVDCALIDCFQHAGKDKKCRGNVTIDKHGEPVCYDPKPKSKLVHEPFYSGVRKKHVTGVLK